MLKVAFPSFKISKFSNGELPRTQNPYKLASPAVVHAVVHPPLVKILDRRGIVDNRLVVFERFFNLVNYNILLTKL